jgi:hypothetical protein
MLVYEACRQGLIISQITQIICETGGLVISKVCRGVLLSIVILLLQAAPSWTSAAEPAVEFDNNMAISLIGESPEVTYGSIKPVHVFTSEPFHDEGKIFRYVLIGYALGGTCHACTLRLAAGIFVEKPNGWALGSVQPDVADVGTFGTIQGSVDAIKLGEDHPGVAIKVNDVHQGEAESYLTLLAIVRGQLVPVWDGPMGTDDSQTLPCLEGKTKCPNWVSVMDVLPSAKKGWFDLQFRTKGSDARDDGSVVDIDRVQRLQFDGNAYVNSSSR